MLLVARPASDELPTMGKSKFIDKRHAQTFSVVRRSQRDPLIADESSSPFVLVPVDNPKVERRVS